MKEIRLHGRGGQGTVMMAVQMVRCLALSGLHASSIPMFGFERRGTPVEAYVRMDEAPIREKTKIYEPHCVVVMDPTLLSAVDVVGGMRVGGTLVINHKGSPGDLCLPPAITRVGMVDANSIAIDFLGSPITNTCMMGAFAASTGWIDLNSIYEALCEDFSGDKLDKNCKAVEMGFSRCQLFEV